MKLTDIPSLKLHLGLRRMLDADFEDMRITKLTAHFVAGWYRHEPQEPWKSFHITATAFFAANPDELELPHESGVPRDELFSTSAEDRKRIARRRAELRRVIFVAFLILAILGFLWLYV